MYRIKYLLCAALLCVVMSASAKHTTVPFMQSIVEIVDSAEGAALLGKETEYPKLFSKFDIEGRMGVGASVKDYLPLAMQHTKNWTEKEEEDIKAAFAAIEKYFMLEGVKPNVPKTIYLIRSDTKQEFGAEGYTRGSSIILNTDVLPVTPGLMAHELFHVYSRYNEQKRDKLYSVFGFKKCNTIELNNATGGRNITNPDCPVVSHYVTVNGQDMTLLLYSGRDYTGGSVLEEYIKIGAILLTGDDKHKQVKQEGGKAVIKELQDVPDLFKQVGTNTDYLLHPEEVCAEHFSMMISGKDARQPELLERFKDVFLH